MNNEDKFREILRKHGITKCYVSEGFDFESDFPEGEIRVDTKDIYIINDLYAIFTEDGFVDEEQDLFIWFTDSHHTENFII